MPGVTARRGTKMVLPPALRKAHVGATKKTWTCKRGHLPHAPVQPPMVQSSPASDPAGIVDDDMDDAQKVLEELPPREDPS
ncbi:hypothetical protein SETIT_8G128900v2 [Setaria italica]|uniref:Uncharacterized protein n=2 Tax=Setaria TaxID=4554 RepID=A0A368S755_SETIT|nr:hypothetical protein SETIT_8G128900v2 [Setaria italica]TKW00800.1 hypothetical protein SEVIR_8G136000v2 [Setaria viridis]